MKKHLPTITLVVFACWLIGSARPPKDKEWATKEFGGLPAVANGRIQPLDSLARNTLLQLREKQSANLEPWKDFWKKPKILSGIEWFMEVAFRPEQADNYPVFRIDHPDVVSLLKLPAKNPEENQDGKHYSWNELRPNYDALYAEAKRIFESKKEASERNPFEQAVLKLHAGVNTYGRLKNTFRPQDSVNFPRELEEFQAAIPAGIKAFKARANQQPYDTNAFTRLSGPATKFDAMREMEPPYVIPPRTGEDSHDWLRVGDVLIERAQGQPLPQAVTYYAQMSAAYRDGRVADFNQIVSDYRKYLADGHGKELKKAAREQYFNFFAPFYKALVLYVIAFLLACAFWFKLNEGLRRSAVWLILLAFIVHTGGLITRMVLEGRPPVTNLYSSAIFIGWGAVVLGLVLERFYKDGIGAVVASSVGFLTLIIAHNLALGGDTMEMMRAVLDTNFWLATHVVIVTLGYASTFVAGFLALIYILRGMFTTTLSIATGKALARMIYGIICFATLFSFVGTVLGGIWADQSWGRFWGWDPKENGALIIVIWNALILHARWGGMVKERGLVNLAIVGNIVTSWSWFGVNMLGIGLHSYGKMDAAVRWLMVFVVSQLGLVALGMLPSRYWASFSGEQPADDPGASPAPALSTKPVAPIEGKAKPLPSA